jgi:hypothetical protein
MVAILKRGNFMICGLNLQSLVTTANNTTLSQHELRLFEHWVQVKIRIWNREEEYNRRVEKTAQ